MIGRSLLVLLYLTSSYAAPQTSPLDLQMTPAWEGYARPGVATELGIALVSRQGGEASVVVSSVDINVSQNVTLRSGIRENFPVVVRPATAASISVRAEIDAAPIPHSVSFEPRFLTPRQRLVVDLTDGDLYRELADSHTVGVVYLQSTVQNLPENWHAFFSVDALLLDMQVLRQFTITQLRALNSYLASCGVVYIRDLDSTPLRGELEKFAGCGGRSLHPGEEFSIAELMANPGLWADNDRSQQLASLDRHLDLRGDNWHIVLLYLSVYVAALAVLGFAANAGLLLSAPVIVAAMGLLVWLNAPLSSSWTYLLAQRDTAGLVEYTAMLRLQGGGKGQAAIELPAALGIPESAADTDFTELSFTGSAMSLNIDTQLFSPHVYRWRGVIQPPYQVRLNLDATGPVVENRGKATAPESVLVWAKGRYPVPALAPGDRWVPSTEPESWRNTEIEQFGRRESFKHGAVLLMAVEEGRHPKLFGGLAARGWLVLTPTGTSPQEQR